MKRLFSYILILITGTVLLAACTDNTFNSEEFTDGQIGLKLALNLPSSEYANTRAGGTNAGTGIENGEEFENWIQANDVRLLIFSNNKFAEEVTNLQITGLAGSEIRYLEGKTSNLYEGEIEIVVLINLKSRGVNPSTTDFENKSVEETYKLLEYSYGTEAWTLSEEKRIPMWGNLKMTLQTGPTVNKGNIDVYRAVAKTNILVNNGTGLDNFILRSVRVYYANTKGYCAPLQSDITAGDTEVRFSETSIPTSNSQRETPLIFTWSQDITINTFENQIYIPESNNTKPGEGKKPLCLVVGGIFGGEGLVNNGEESYYRIDFKDDLESGNKDDLRVYDVIRNHSYVFNIRSVSNPGTPTPEEALDNVVVGMHVSIEDWEDIPMRGIPDQYTLTTNKSVVTFDNKISNDEITVTTDYGQDNESTENGPWKIVDKSDDTWFTVEQGEDNRTIYIKAIENFGVAREGSFYVQTGNLKKQIIVRQEQPATANCYVVGDGTYELIVTIKGNGNKGLVADDKNGGVVTLDESASIKPAKIGIIWETKKGLVKLIDAESKTQVSGGTYAKYDEGKGTIQYVVNTNGASIGGITGGNALIGAFDKNGKVLWSWHVWACPSMVDANGFNGIKKSCIQDWTLNGYEVLDRNLGALNNVPGVASLGLLYQWGRKDPFIGAAYTNDNYTDNGRLTTYNYYNKEWKVDSGRNTNISYTIENPTILTYDGLSSKELTKGGYLWGTNGGLNHEGIKDLGSKTIYDPCPEGYRIPPVDAFVFTDKTTKQELVIDNAYSVTLYQGENLPLNPPVYINGELSEKKITISGSRRGTYYYIVDKFHYRTVSTITKSSETANWNDNLIYIPHKASKLQNDWTGSYYYTGIYVENAKYYGFYLNYKSLKEPNLKDGNKTDNYVHYDLADYTDLAWLPISGAYDPHIKNELTFKDIIVTQGSSLSVNSFLWTNSSVVSQDRTTRPAAMFLHGTENTYNYSNGRHIHALLGTSASDNIIAEPQQAGAVRCVRDVKKDFSESNREPDPVSLGSSSGKSVIGTLISVNDSWVITDGGAPWLKISPDRGELDKGKGQNITFTTVQANRTGNSRTVTVLIKFASEAKPRSFKVTQSN